MEWAVPTGSRLRLPCQRVYTLPCRWAPWEGGSRYGEQARTWGARSDHRGGLAVTAVQVEHSRPLGPFSLETCGRMTGSEQDRQGCQAESSLPASYPAPLCTLHPKC